MNLKRHTYARLIGFASVPALVILSLGGGAGQASAADDTDTGSTQQVAPLVQPSVVYETITWSGYIYDTFNDTYLRTDEPFTVRTQCTGFVVNPDGWVATAGHCVHPDLGKEAIRRAAAEWALTSDYYATPELLTVEDVVGDFRVDTFDQVGHVVRNRVDREVKVSWGASVSGVDVEKRKPARVVDYQAFTQGDSALLKVEETDLNAIELADADGVEINSDVTSIGYPAIIDTFTDPDLTPTFQPGTVSSLKTLENGLVKVLQLSAQLSGGMSGGPTVDGEGNVIGINSAGFPGEPFNYAVPSDRIQELMSGAGVENVVSETTEKYRTGIRAYFDGDRAKAISALTSVLEAQPANGLARDFLKKAQELPVPPAPAPKPEDQSGLDQWMLIAGGGTAALMSAAAAALLRRRKPKSNADLSLHGDPALPRIPEQAAAPYPESFTGQDRDWHPMPDRTPVPSGVGGNGTSPGSEPVDPSRTQQVSLAPPENRSFCTTCGHHTTTATVFCGTCGTKQPTD